jgi:hypothetical protein
MRQDLLDKINDLAVSIAKVSSWSNSKDAFGHIIIDKKGVEKVAQKDYIYEFYCYMKIIEDLDKKPNHKIKFIKGNGIFPKKPVLKNNRPYFILKVDRKEVFQICSGTKIQTKIINITKAPDISFQSMTADDKLPSHKDILAIYDAKYSQSKNVNSFQEGQMVLFSDMIKLLKLKKPTDISMYFTDFKDFKGNCLITNKKSLTNDLDLLKYYKMTIIEDFDEKQKINVIK